MSTYELDALFSGVPVSGSSRGPLGWSTVLLIRVSGSTGSAARHYLFDTGGHNERPALIRRLAERGLGAGDIDGVILSHVHFDHAANWTLFPQAELYVHPKELAPPEATEDFAVPDFHTEMLCQHPRLRRVEEDDEIDGMRVIEAPGHTQGLFALAVGPDVLASDSIKNRAELSPDHPLSNTWSREVARRSIARIAGLAARRIYPGHDVPLVRRDDCWVASAPVDEWITVSDGVCSAAEPHRFDIRVAQNTPG